jgi:hypothetical protein
MMTETDAPLDVTAICAHMTQIDLSSWSLVPGPEFDPPPDSLGQYEVAQYSPDDIAAAILLITGFGLQHPAEPTWWEWKARWDYSKRWIEVGMTLFDVEPLAWGGSPLSGKCMLSDIMRLWLTLRTQFPAVWMHNAQCEFHTPESFPEAVLT